MGKDATNVEREHETRLTPSSYLGNYDPPLQNRIKRRPHQLLAQQPTLERIFHDLNLQLIHTSEGR